MFKLGFRKRKRTNLSAMIFGLCFSFFSFLALALVFSLLLSTLKNPLGFIGIFAVAALLISGAASGFFTAKFKGEGAFLPISISTLVFGAIMFVCGIIVTRGMVPLITVLNLLAYCALVFAFAALAMRKRRTRRRR